MKTIILISGKMGVGKTTLQTYLVEELSAEPMRFVSVLYEMHDACRTISMKYGLPFPEKFREFLEIVGTEVFRNHLSQTYWVDALRSKISQTDSDIIVIDDARFPNEIEAFDNDSSYRVVKIRLNADEAIRQARCSKWGDQTHISNTALDDYNFPYELDVTELNEAVVGFDVINYLRSIGVKNS